MNQDERLRSCTDLHRRAMEYATNADVLRMRGREGATDLYRRAYLAAIEAFDLCPDDFKQSKAVLKESAESLKKQCGDMNYSLIILEDDLHPPITLFFHGCQSSGGYISLTDGGLLEGSYWDIMIAKVREQRFVLTAHFENPESTRKWAITGFIVNATKRVDMKIFVGDMDWIGSPPEGYRTETIKNGG